MSKVFYGTRELKKGERRPTMMEASAHNQIKYWGVKKADKVAIDKMNKTTTKDKEKEKLPKLRGKISGLKYKAEKIRDRIETAQRKNDTVKLKKYNDELEKMKEQYHKSVQKLKELEK